jgi:hypothetical protein
MKSHMLKSTSRWLPALLALGAIYSGKGRLDLPQMAPVTAAATIGNRK